MDEATPGAWLMHLGISAKGSDTGDVPDDAAEVTPAQLKKLQAMLGDVGSGMTEPTTRYNDFHNGTGVGGGEFASGPSSGGGKTPAKKPAPKGKAPAHHGGGHTATHHTPSGGSTGTLAFDPKAGHGTGYGYANGDAKVHTLQQALTRLGIHDASGKALKNDGKLGPKTTAAVKKLQRRLGLPANGQVTQAFLKELAGMKSLPHAAAHHQAAHHPAAHRGEDLTDMAVPFVRSFALQDISIRAGGDGRTVDAYATVFDTPTPIHDQDGDYIEVIDPAAFNRILPKLAPAGGRSSWRVGVFYNHGMTLHGTPSDMDSMPIGVPLEIKADSHGLFTRTRYHSGARADMVLEAIREGSIAGYSFSGRFDRSDPPSSRGGYRADRAGNLRTVRRTESTLREYGPTPFPAYQDAAIIGVRAEKISEQLDRITELLRSGAPLEEVFDDDSPLRTGAPDWDSPSEDSHELVRSGRSVKEEMLAARSAFLQKYGSRP